MVGLTGSKDQKKEGDSATAIRIDSFPEKLPSGNPVRAPINQIGLDVELMRHYL